MEKCNEPHQIDMNTPEGNDLINNVRSNLMVNVEVSGNYEVFLKISINKDYAYQALGDFLKQSILKRSNFMDNQLINAINVSLPNFIKTNNSGFMGLTPKEVEIMDRLSEGKTLKEISMEISMPINTIKTHLKNIYRKLNVKKAPLAIIEFLKMKGVIQHPLADIHMALTQLGFIKGLN